MVPSMARSFLDQAVLLHARQHFLNDVSAGFEAAHQIGNGNLVADQAGEALARIRR